MVSPSFRPAYDARVSVDTHRCRHWVTCSKSHTQSIDGEACVETLGCAAHPARAPRVVSGVRPQAQVWTRRNALGALIGHREWIVGLSHANYLA